MTEQPRHIDMDEMREELDGLRAVMEILLSDLDNETEHIVDCPPSAAHAYFAQRVVNLYQPAWNHIFSCIQDLHHRAGEATA